MWPAIPGIAYGGDVNPEQWSRSVLDDDVQLMVDAGVNLVTLGVFSWALLEPEPGQFHTAWLHEAVDAYAAGGIGVDLATATASPPRWLAMAYPESLPVDAGGVRRWPGGRQAYCPSSSAYRDAATRLVDRLASEFADVLGVVMWHANNEIGCHTPACWCDASATAFRAWARLRYGDDLDALNNAWGGSVWSQRIGRWEEVLPPRITPDGTAPPPGLMLDFHRFANAELLELFLAEKRAIRAYDEVRPITTNFMSMAHIDWLDYSVWASHVDLVSTDHYPIADDVTRVVDLALQADRTRGWAGGAPWLLMEHAPGAVNWQPRNRTKASGEMLRDALMHVAHGADGTLFFQWRAAAAGPERFHAGMVPHAGTDSPRWDEVRELGQVLRRMDSIAGSRVVNEVAIIMDAETTWMLKEPNLPSVDLDHEVLAREWYEQLFDLDVGVDIVSAGAGLDGYKVILVPMVALMSDVTAARIVEAAEQGAHVLVSYFSGIVDEHDRVRLGGYPGALRRLLGVRITEFAPLLVGESVELTNGWTGRLWSEIGIADGAEVQAVYATGPGVGSVAVTKRRSVAGNAWYVGTHLESWEPLLVAVLDGAGVAYRTDTALHTTTRIGDGRQWRFVFNLSPVAKQVDARGFDLVAEKHRDGTFELDAGAVAVIETS